MDTTLASVNRPATYAPRNSDMRMRPHIQETGGLGEFVKDVLLDSRTLNRPCLDGRCLEGVVNSHVKGNRNYTSEIHRALTTELIQRQLIEQS